jgi:predicted AAA+ superfamily ATPase
MDMQKTEILQSYVQRNISLAPDLFRNYTSDAQGNVLFHRWAYYRLRKLVDDHIAKRGEDRWIVFSGLRGTGKTTLLAQMYFYLLEKRVPTRNVLYVSLDEVTGLLGSNLNDVISVYEGLLQSSLERLQENIFLLVDEAHYDKNWGITQKTVFDRTKRAFMITTGSSALSLQTSSDAARRARSEKLLPLNFPEYVMLKHRSTQTANLKQSVEKALFSSRDAAQAHSRISALGADLSRYWSTIKPYEIEKFLTVGSLPFSIAIENDNEVHRRVLSILAKVINEDIPAFRPFEKETLGKIWNLLLLLSINEKISYESLCSDLGLAKATLSDVLDILMKSEIIYPVRAYGSLAKGVRRAPKYKFVAPAIKASLLWRAGKLTRTPEIYGKLLEDAVASCLYRLRQTEGWPEFYHDPEKGGADFILVLQDGSKLVLEVGYGHKTAAQIRKSAVKVAPRYSVMVSESELRLDREANVLFIPKNVFLSM